MAIRGVNKKSLSWYILLALEKTVDLGVELNDMVNNPNYYIYGTGNENLKQSAFSQAIKRLRERGLIENYKVDADKVMIKLTALGKDALGRDEKKEWDGKWRIVLFDIPEQKRIVRNLFRRRLKEWGFKNLQQSVWVTQRNITDRLKILIHDLKVEDWVAVIESDNVSFGNKMMYGRTS